jgi:tetratricopeptide (TPR) repeat protein
MKRFVGVFLALSFALSGCASPKGPDDLSLQADTNVAAGKYKKALAQYDGAIALSDKDSALFAKRATVKSLLNEHKSALEDYNRAIVLRPNVGWYYSKRAKVLGELNKPAAAIDSANRALSLDGEEPQTLAYRANAYTQLGQYDRALEDAIQAKQGGDLVYTYKVLGTCYIHLGKPDEALDCLQKAIDLNPEEPGLLCLKADAEMQKLDLRQAIATAQRARDLNPNSTAPYSCLARAYLLSGEFEWAKENIDKVLTRSKRDGIALQTVYFMASNDMKRALSSALSVVEERPTPESKQTLAEAYIFNGRAEEALRICDGLASENPALASVHRGRALALLALGRHEDARQAASKSIALLSYNPIAFRLRAEALERMGNSSDAYKDRLTAEKLGYSSKMPQEQILTSLRNTIAEKQGGGGSL